MTSATRFSRAPVRQAPQAGPRERTSAISSFSSLPLAPDQNALCRSRTSGFPGSMRACRMAPIPLNHWLGKIESKCPEDNARLEQAHDNRKKRAGGSERSLRQAHIEHGQCHRDAEDAVAEGIESDFRDHGVWSSRNFTSQNIVRRPEPFDC